VPAIYWGVEITAAAGGAEARAALDSIKGMDPRPSKIGISRIIRKDMESFIKKRSLKASPWVVLATTQGLWVIY
jgi:hypothetical protein